MPRLVVDTRDERHLQHHAPAPWVGASAQRCAQAVAQRAGRVPCCGDETAAQLLIGRVQGPGERGRWINGGAAPPAGWQVCADSAGNRQHSGGSWRLDSAADIDALAAAVHYAAVFTPPTAAALAILTGASAHPEHIGEGGGRWSDGRDGDSVASKIKPFGVYQARHGSPYILGVVRGLAHPHEDYVGHGWHAQLGRRPPRRRHLRQDFSRAQVAQQTHPASGTKAAALPTSNL
mmetsp:Transcript_29715/g.95973  ORF Transcript_29715/g.95973 Transcript_29715/m.95973 type:complete len:234 (-) Transcript_29715:169-870(-)